MEFKKIHSPWLSKEEKPQGKSMLSSLGFSRFKTPTDVRNSNPKETGAQQFSNY